MHIDSFRTFFTRHVGFPILDLWQGDQRWLYRREARSILSATSLEAVHDFQLRRLRRVLAHADQTVPFYRRRFQAAGLRPSDTQVTFQDLHRIPPLTKADIQIHIQDLTSSRLPKAKLRHSATGGTTTSPTMIYMDWPTVHRRRAATELSDEAFGYFRGRKIAYLWGASQDFPSLSWKTWLVNELSTRALWLPASPLDEATMSRYYAELRRFSPSFLQAYPTPLSIFAEFLLKRNLQLNISSISVTAEPLLPEQSQLIRRAFGVIPFDWYGARECGRIAAECKCHAGMHINSYGVYLELENVGNYDDPDVGDLLITDLWNAGMPMIRYRIGDLAKISREPCNCGSVHPRILQIVGRTVDVFINSRGQRIAGVALTNRIIRDNSQIREIQIIQKTVRQFELCVVPGPDWNGEAAESIVRMLEEFMQEPVEVVIRIMDSIPRERSGKLRMCKSEVDQDLKSANATANIDRK